jgi:hypothetical protein
MGQFRVRRGRVGRVVSRRVVTYYLDPILIAKVSDIEAGACRSSRNTKNGIDSGKQPIAPAIGHACVYHTRRTDRRNADTTRLSIGNPSSTRPLGATRIQQYNTTRYNTTRHDTTLTACCSDLTRRTVALVHFEARYAVKNAPVPTAPATATGIMSSGVRLNSANQPTILLHSYTPELQAQGLTSKRMTSNEEKHM